eukprot:TRINITY_DN15907_c0_g1_i1.p1 TRINITY_DN15907_c0_g1~~TRINITY_DN15907_c0_g1_i1.p1  ORF type:complete len:135 (-),score=16.58 TRINITY_DN15907_c0_g1_i1:535-939(-)
MVFQEDCVREICKALQIKTKVSIGLELAVSRQMIRVVSLEPRSYGFVSKFLRERLYQMQPLSQRRIAHGAYAKVLEGREYCELRGVASMLGMHLMSSWDYYLYGVVDYFGLAARLSVECNSLDHAAKVAYEGRL